MKPSQSLAGYIRQHLSELEARLDVGVRQDVIVQELEAEGYKTTLKAFRNLLYRARQKAAERGIETPSPVHRKEPNEQQVKPEPKEQETPTNSLTKRTSFEYKGTKDVKKEDLI